MSTSPQPSASTTPAAAGAAPAATAAAVVPGYETASAAEESRFHNYVGHAIPWYVRVAWLLFWVLSAWYVIRWLLPALDSELLSPP